MPDAAVCGRAPNPCADGTGLPHFRTPADITCNRARCPICSPRRSLIIPRAPRKAKSAENVKFSVTVDSPQLSCRPNFPQRHAFALGLAFCPCRAAYAAALEEETGIETVLYDERLTTVSAHRYLSDTGVSGKKRKESVDELSATLILQDYIDRYPEKLG